EITITISDEGEGIPKEELPYLFERLYRVEKSRSRESGGTGLGLAIAKEIIESHGGTIEIESELGKGTRVIVHLTRGEYNGYSVTNGSSKATRRLIRITIGITYFYM